VRDSARADPSREAVSRTVGHMAMLEPSLAGRRVPNLHGSTRAHPGREARFEATGHVAALEPASAGR
jgi:hypothetical protein